MSNIFRTNSRFAVLADELPKKSDQKPKPNTPVTPVKSNMNKQNCYKNTNYKKEESNLSSDNFPALVTKQEPEEKIQNNSISFLDKAKLDVTKLDKLSNIDAYVKMNPEWTIITRDSITKQIIVFNDIKPILPEKFVNLEIDSPNDVLHRLCDLHELRTQEYIEMKGYDQWEKTFRATKFDCLNDQSDEEIEEEDIEDIEDNSYSDFITDSDKHVNYWKQY